MKDEFDVEPRFQGVGKFDPNPQFYNHMCHWRAWADHFQESEDKEKMLLAKMLYSALEEINRLCKISVPLDKKYSMLLFAFIRLVETKKPVPFSDGESNSFGSAFADIQLLNSWRAENKLNIKAVDV